MIDLNFSLEGGEVVSRRLGITAKGVRSFKEPFNHIAINLMKTFDMNFASRGELYGGWAPRKPQYRNGQRIDTWPLLEKTGKMRRRFEADVKDTSLVIANPTSYFVYHQSNQPRHKLPRRVMMKLREQDAAMVVREFQYYLVKILRHQGER